MNSVGQQLYDDRNWRQGSLFLGQGLTVTRNIVGDAPCNTALEHRLLMEDEWCVVASQDCDILSDSEKQIEALACEQLTTQQASGLSNPRNYSARYFLVDPETGLVAIAADRLFVAKEVLLERRPEDWPAPPRFSRFVQWLGRRYTRPALPNELVTDFQAPIVAALVRLAKSEPETMRAFSASVLELRVVPPETVMAPLEVELVFLLGDTGLNTEAADALAAVEAAIRSAIDPSRVHIVDIRSRSLNEMSVGEYFSSAPMFLDSLSYRGDEITGAEPINPR